MTPLSESGSAWDLFYFLMYIYFIFMFFPTAAWMDLSIEFSITSFKHITFHTFKYECNYNNIF